jgi:hypothetical protein
LPISSSSIARASSILAIDQKIKNIVAIENIMKKCPAFICSVKNDECSEKTMQQLHISLLGRFICESIYIESKLDLIRHGRESSRVPLCRRRRCCRCKLPFGEWVIANARALSNNKLLLQWKASAIAQSGFKIEGKSALHRYYKAVVSPPYRGVFATVLGMTWARATIFYGSDYGKHID